MPTAFAGVFKATKSIGSAIRRADFLNPASVMDDLTTDGARSFMSPAKLLTNTDEGTGHYVLTNIKNGNTPTVIANVKTGERIMAADGQVHTFNNPEAAVEYLLRDKNVPYEDVPSKIRDPGGPMESFKLIGEDWRIEPLTFKSNRLSRIPGSKFIPIKKARTDVEEYIRAYGRGLGSTNPKDYATVGNGMDPTVTDLGRGGRGALGVQRMVDKFLGVRRMTTEAVDSARDQMRKLGLDESSERYRSTIYETPEMVMENAQNSSFIAESTLFVSPFKLVDDPKATGFKYYEVDHDAKSLMNILATTGTKLDAAGLKVAADSERELGAYMLAKRLVALSDNPRLDKHGERVYSSLTSDEGLKNARALITDIDTNQAVKSQIYNETMEEFKTFNLHLLNFVKDHDATNMEQMKKMLGDDLGDFFIPIRRGSKVAGGDAGDILGGVNKQSDTLKRYLQGYQGPDADVFINPIRSYMQSVKSIIRSSVDNRSKVKMYDLLDAAHPALKRKYVKSPDKAKQVVLSTEAVESALRRNGYDIDEGFVTPDNINIVSMWIRDDLKGADNVDFYYKGGELQQRQIIDPLLIDYVFTGGSKWQGKHWGALPLHGLAKLHDMLQFVITHVPSFNTLTALPADATGSYLLNPKLASRYNLPFINAFVGMAVDHNSDDFLRFVANGGALSGLKTAASASAKKAHYVERLAAQVPAVKKYLKGNHVVFGLGEEGDRAATGLIMRGIYGLADKTENATRYATFKEGVRQGGSIAQSANEAAKYSIDFRLKGTSELATLMQRATVPFFRAMVNSLYQTGRLVSTAPGSKARIAKIALLPTTFVAALIASYQVIETDDGTKYIDKFSQIPRNERNMWHYIPAPGISDGWIRMRKSHELLIPATLFENMIMHMYEDDVYGGKQWATVMGRHALQSIADTTRLSDGLFGVMPPALNAIMGMQTGQRSVGSGTQIPIVSEKGVAAEGQRIGALSYVPGNASPALVDTAEWVYAVQDYLGMVPKGGVPPINLAPKEIGFLVDSFFGMASSMIVDTLDDFIIPAFDSTREFKFNIGQAPVFSKLFKSTYGLKRSSYEDDLFSILDQIVDIDKTIDNATGSGSLAKVDKTMGILNKNLPSFAARDAIRQRALYVKEGYTGYMNSLANTAVEYDGKREADIKAREIFQERNDFLQLQMRPLMKAWSMVKGGDLSAAELDIIWQDVDTRWANRDKTPVNIGKVDKEIKLDKELADEPYDALAQAIDKAGDAKDVMNWVSANGKEPQLKKIASIIAPALGNVKISTANKYLGANGESYSQRIEMRPGVPREEFVTEKNPTGKNNIFEPEGGGKIIRRPKMANLHGPVANNIRVHNTRESTVVHESLHAFLDNTVGNFDVNKLYDKIEYEGRFANSPRLKKVFPVMQVVEQLWSQLDRDPNKFDRDTRSRLNSPTHILIYALTSPDMREQLKDEKVGSSDMKLLDYIDTVGIEMLKEMVTLANPLIAKPTRKPAR